MKKPKPPKQKEDRPKPQPTPQPKPQRHLIWQVLQTWWGIPGAILAAIGAAQSVVSAFDAFLTIYRDTTPEIHLAADDQKPFILPFKVRNPSRFFPMSDAEFACDMERVVSRNGSSIVNVRTTNFDRPMTIWATGDATLHCPIKIEDVETAIVYPIIKYRTLWINREFRGVNSLGMLPLAHQGG